MDVELSLSCELVLPLALAGHLLSNLTKTILHSILGPDGASNRCELHLSSMTANTKENSSVFGDTER